MFGLGTGALIGGGLGLLSSIGGGKGDPATTEPLYYPAFEGAAGDIGNRAQWLMGAQSPIYPGELVAPMFSPTLAAAGGIEDLFYSGDPQGLQAGQQMAAQAGGYQPQYTAGFNVPMASQTGMEAQAGSGLEAIAMRALGPRQTFDPRSFARDVPQYMDPYIRHVLDRQQDRLRRRLLEKQISRQGAAGLSGAFGGSRLAVQDALAERDYNEQLANIEAQGLSNAFQQAQGQYNTALKNNLQAEQQALQLGLGAFGDIGRLGSAIGGRRIQMAELDERARQAEEAARLAGEKMKLDAATALAGMGQRQQELGLDRINAMLGLGSLQRDYAQDIMDADREQFMFQAGYPLDLAAQVKAIIGSPSGTMTTPARAPFMTRALGGLMGGLSFGKELFG